MKANQLKLGQLVLKNNKLVVISTNDLSEILKEESINADDRIYTPILLSEKWLKILGFTKKINPVTKDILYIDQSGLQVKQYKNMIDFCLGYNFKEENGAHQYSPKIMFLHELFDAFQLIKNITFSISPAQLEKIEKLMTIQD